MSDSIHDLAIEIIVATNDGDDLAPHHLKLVEMAVNGFLDAKGEAAFRKLAENVRCGYKKPWFHGIEHLTFDQEGFVYWKGVQVEHYTPRWAYSEEAHQQALILAERCKYLEENGVEITGTTQILNWDYPPRPDTSDKDSPAR